MATCSMRVRGTLLGKMRKCAKRIRNISSGPAMDSSSIIARNKPCFARSTICGKFSTSIIPLVS